MHPATFIEGTFLDLRHALRMILRNPTFSLVAILTLAIGIGVNAAMVSVVNGILIRPLPYPNPDALVAVWQSGTFEGRAASVNFTPSMFWFYHDQNRTFEQFGVWHSGAVSITDVGEPEQVRTLWVTQEVLPALGIQAVRGRWFSPSDDSPGTEETAILSYGYWKRRFGGNPDVTGRSITIDSRPHYVIGVMPETFQFLDLRFDILLPERLSPTDLSQSFRYQGVARLKSGVTLAQADSDVARMLPTAMSRMGLSSEILETIRYRPDLRPLKQEVVGNIGKALWVLMGGIGIVLLIACANVANLLLVRAEARRPELAIRAALGAGSQRIARELLVESLALAVFGGVLGLMFAYLGVRLLTVAAPMNLPRLSQITIDVTVLVFTVVAVLFSTLVFGSIPILKLVGPKVFGSMRSNRTITRSREHHRAINLLVVGQVSLALVLLISSGLMLRSFQQLRSIEPGFTRPEEVQTVRISITASQVESLERVFRMQNDILNRLAAIPGAESAAFTNTLPMEVEPGYVEQSVVSIEGKPEAPGEIPPLRKIKSVSPGSFKTFGTALVAGRDFTWSEFNESRAVAVVSESMAREFWGTAPAAIGKRIRESWGAWREVIGIAANVYDEGAHRPPTQIVYLPASPQTRFGRTYVPRSVAFAIRSSRTGTGSFMAQIQDAIWAVDPNLPLARVQTLNAFYERSMASTSFTAAILAIAGTMALALGLIGIYGMLAYKVVQRRREVGIRVALGAQRGMVKRMFVLHGLALSAVGIVIGLVAAAGLSRLMSSLLFGVRPLDPVTYVVAAGILLITALAASYFPACRAAAVEPVETLRRE